MTYDPRQYLYVQGGGGIWVIASSLLLADFLPKDVLEPRG
jgi:hypothetical protein